MEIRIVPSEAAQVSVPDEVAQDLQDTYLALSTMSNRNLAVSDFDSKEAANLWVKQARAWAGANELIFSRRPSGGDDKIAGNPLRVTFRVYRATADK
jgi:post-segregation antitoxin (ccd killing protein)